MACKTDGGVWDERTCERGPRPQRALYQEPGSLLNCFRHVNAFAEALDDETKCGEIARAALDVHPGPAGGIGHIGMGSCFYLGGLLDKLDGKSVTVVETSSCDADIRQLPSWLGLNASFAETPAFHTGSYPHHSDEISEAGREKLRRHLAHEYALQRELRELAGRRAQ